VEIGLKIRGIYTTALTKFFLDHNLAIVQPSEATRERFSGCKKIDSSEPIGVEIEDLEDKQGILLRGEPVKLHFVLNLLREKFFDALFWQRKYGGLDFAEIEFPYLTKSRLDELRNEVVVTVPHHHRLKIIASQYVDLMEKMELTTHPEKREDTGEALEKTLIWDTLVKGKLVSIDHVKLDGNLISLSEGEIVKIFPEERRLILKRTGYQGRNTYDGLGLPKEAGDYALTEAREGNWFYRHTYYRRDGRLIGEYCNVNTPLEFYPDRIRYIDLEIDVVRWPEGKVKVVEEELLDQKVKLGYLSEELAERAKRVARALKEKLSQQRG
jgi:protein associated with RNAse G/E